jgi:hypothetical protein
MLPEDLEAARNRAAVAVEPACDLPLCDLRDEFAEDAAIERRPAQAVVDAEGLRRERALAALALEALHRAAVAGAREGASALVLE